jgi:hypothetical protein
VNDVTVTSDTTPKRLLTPGAEARHLLGGIGWTKYCELINERQLERVFIGRRSYVTTASLLAFVERLRGADDSSSEVEAGQDEVTTDGGDE